MQRESVSDRPRRQYEGTGTHQSIRTGTDFATLAGSGDARSFAVPIRFRTPSPPPWRVRDSPPTPYASSAERHAFYGAVVRHGDVRMQGDHETGTNHCEFCQLVQRSGGLGVADAQQNRHEDSQEYEQGLMYHLHNLGTHVVGGVWSTVEIASWACGCSPRQFVLNASIWAAYVCLKKYYWN